MVLKMTGGIFPVLLTLFTITSARVVSSAAVPQDGGILSYESTNDGRGNYRFSFETFDHTKREEVGTLVHAGQPDEYLVVNGFYSYVRPDGEEEIVFYTADKDGYKIKQKGEPEMQIQTVQSLPAGVIASLLGK